MALKDKILRAHERARFEGLPPGVEAFPPAVQRFFSNIAGYEPAEFVRRLAHGHGTRALVVGVGAGRDTYWLMRDGYEVVSLDITSQDDIPRLILGDMSFLPFTDESFDVVVVADVLEHSFEDHKAITEFARVLRSTGVFVLNVPFRDDRAEYHARVYTERTLARLLASGGFRIEQRIYRGVFPWLESYVPGVRELWHGANLFVYLLLRRQFYERVLVWMTERDWRHGHRALLRRFSRVHGVYLKALPDAKRIEMRRVNEEQFRNQAESMGQRSSRSTMPYPP